MSDAKPTANIDQAALVAVLLVAAFQITGEPGPWHPINTVIGALLLLMIAAYAQPSPHRRLGPIRLQVLAVAVGVAVALCLLVAWPAQEWLVRPVAEAAGVDLTGRPGADLLGDYTTQYVFPAVLVLGSSVVYWFILGRVLPAARAASTAPAAPAAPVNRPPRRDGPPRQGRTPGQDGPPRQARPGRPGRPER